MSASRDEYTRVVFTRSEAIPRPIGRIYVTEDVNETIIGGAYYGPVDIITMAAESMSTSGVALQGVTHLSPSQVGMDIATSLQEDRKVFLISPNRAKKGVFFIEEVFERDVKAFQHGMRVDFGLSRTVVEALALQDFVAAVYHSSYSVLSDRSVSTE